MTRFALRLLLAILVTTSMVAPVWSQSTPAAAAEPDTELDSGASASTGMLRQFEVTLSQQLLDAVWPELFGTTVAPQLVSSLPFDAETVVVYSTGTRPDECYAAEIASVRSQGETFFLEVNEVGPAPNCVCTFSGVDASQVRRLAGQGGAVTLCVRRPALDC